MRTRCIAVLAVVAACGKFEDPNIVVDLRVIGMTASKPEQVLKVDLANPPQPADLLAQMVPSEVCAYVADPANDGRRIQWTMTLCPLSGDERCNSGDPHSVVDHGVIDDPDTTVPEPRLCATVNPDGNLLGVVTYALDNDPLKGLEGEAYEVELRVGGEDGERALDLYASKQMQVIADLPAGRQANQNPTLTEIDATLPDATAAVPLGLGRCVDQAAPLAVTAGTKIRLLPIEPDGARETYAVVKLDGTFATFTESLTYQWVAGAGKFSSGDTGGTRDPFGNSPALFSDWTAPAVKDLDNGMTTDFPIWIIERDERLGATMYESCIRVTP